jgi:hypothetical protein
MEAKWKAEIEIRNLIQNVALEEVQAVPGRILLSHLDSRIKCPYCFDSDS